MKETKNTLNISDGKEPSIIPTLQKGKRRLCHNVLVQRLYGVETRSQA